MVCVRVAQCDGNNWSSRPRGWVCACGRGCINPQSFQAESQLLAVRTIKDNRRVTYNLHFGAVPLDPGPLEMSVIDLSPLDVHFTQTTLGPIVASVDAGALPAVSPALNVVFPTDNFWDSASRGRDTAVLYASMHCCLAETTNLE